MPYPLSPITSAISFASSRILLILYSVSGKIRSTRLLWSLFRNFVGVTKTSCYLMISLPMASLLNKLCVNTATYFTQSGGKELTLRTFLK